MVWVPGSALLLGLHNLDKPLVFLGVCGLSHMIRMPGIFVQYKCLQQLLW